MKAAARVLLLATLIMLMPLPSYAKGNGKKPQLPDAVQTVLLLFQQAVRESRWEDALAHCTEAVEAKAATYKSPKHFLRDILPTKQFVAVKEWPTTGKRRLDIDRNLSFQTYVQLDGGLEWDFSLEKENGTWRVRPKLVPLKEWKKQEKAYATESQKGREAFEPVTPRAFTAEQVERLVFAIMQNLPQFTHVEMNGHDFEWVLAAFEKEGNPAEVEAAVLANLQKKYKMYRSKEEIPEEEIWRDTDGRSKGYKNGFVFSFSISFQSPREIRVGYFDYEGVLCGSGHSTSYRWTGSDWRITDLGQMLVS